MFTLKIKADTWLKLSTAQSAKLKDHEKVFVEKDSTYNVESFLDLGSHLKITLKEPLKGRKSWCCFEDHVILDPGGGVVPEYNLNTGYPNLPVPYYSQRDNKYHPTGTCNITCVAMLLAYYGIPQRLDNCQYEDELFQYLKEEKLRRHYHTDLQKVCHSYGLKTKFDAETQWTKVKKSLASGNPVIISGKFTNYGHIIILRGYDDKGFFVNDPWGEHMPGGWYLNKSGENLHYSYKKVYGCSYGGNRTTWAHLVV